MLPVAGAPGATHVSWTTFLSELSVWVADGCACACNVIAIENWPVNHNNFYHARDITEGWASPDTIQRLNVSITTHTLTCRSKTDIASTCCRLPDKGICCHG